MSRSGAAKNNLLRDEQIESRWKRSAITTTFHLFLIINAIQQRAQEVIFSIMCFPCRRITFGAHERRFRGFAAVAATLVKGEALLARPRHHLGVVRQQATSGPGAHAVNSAGVGVWDEQSTRHRVHRQEVFMGRVVAAVTEEKKSRFFFWFIFFVGRGFRV